MSHPKPKLLTPLSQGPSSSAGTFCCIWCPVALAIASRRLVVSSMLLKICEVFQMCDHEWPCISLVLLAKKADTAWSWLAVLAIGGLIQYCASDLLPNTASQVGGLQVEGPCPHVPSRCSPLPACLQELATVCMLLQAPH